MVYTMKKWFCGNKWCLALCLVLSMLLSLPALASEDDNSLYSLGIQTEGAEVSPEFSYDVWSYTVTVPTGTTELLLDPVPSSELATISDISGTTLNADGTGYVTITVQAGNGSEFTYELNVVSEGPAVPAETEPPTEAPTEPPTETETETEDSRYVRVDRNSLQEAENTITELKGEITSYKDRLSLFTKIMFALIALSVVLLFVVINLLLRKRDLKAELDVYRSYGYTGSKKSGKKSKGGPEGSSPSGYALGTGPASAPRQGVNAPVLQGQGGTQSPAQGQPYQDFGPEVQPQKSQKKAKRPVQEEKPGKAAQNQEAPQVQSGKGTQGSGPAAAKGQPSAKGQSSPKGQAPAKGKTPEDGQAPGKGAPAGKNRGADVEINMIDL